MTVVSCFPPIVGWTAGSGRSDAQSLTIVVARSAFAVPGIMVGESDVPPASLPSRGNAIQDRVIRTVDSHDPVAKGRLGRMLPSHRGEGSTGAARIRSVCEIVAPDRNWARAGSRFIAPLQAATVAKARRRRKSRVHESSMGPVCARRVADG